MARRKPSPARDWYGALQALCNSEDWNIMEPETQEFCMSLLVKYSGAEEFDRDDTIALGNRRIKFMVDSDTNLFTAFIMSWESHMLRKGKFQW